MEAAPYRTPRWLTTGLAYGKKHYITEKQKS
jgi:hypothetical protein